MTNKLAISQEQIKDFCLEHHIKSMALFGSVLRDDFSAGSDIDIMVEFEQGSEPSLMQMIDLEERLSEILGHKVDLVELRSIKLGRNYIRKKHILSSMETIYVAG
ncbi:MAG: nucleotidyltransferase domain-containing protein [Sedimentisphaerales bacterium]|nr:nucleotidyltransferase domain-containing protein [Sedimentisphaerales bacterium]